MSTDYDLTNYSFNRMVADFLAPEGIGPAELGAYEFELHRAYSDVCRESAAAGSSVGGGIVVRPTFEGNRFIATAREFLAGRPTLYNFIKEPVMPWQLYFMFTSYLAQGERCPRESLMGRRLTLLRDFRVLRENFIVYSEKALLEGDVRRASRIERLAQKSTAIMAGLRNMQIGDDRLDAIEGLLDLMVEPERIQTGYLLLDIILLSRNGGVLIPPRFGELVLAGHGGGSPLFRDLVFLLSSPETSHLFGNFFVRLPARDGADPNLQLGRLIFAAANWPASPVRIQAVDYTLKKMADPGNHDEVEALLELLENPDESYVMANAASLDEYLGAENEEPEFEFVQPITDAQFEITACDTNAAVITAVEDSAAGEFDYSVEWEADEYDQFDIVMVPMEWVFDTVSTMNIFE